MEFYSEFGWRGTCDACARCAGYAEGGPRAAEMRGGRLRLACGMEGEVS
jgi:hypothetical protein